MKTKFGRFVNKGFVFELWRDLLTWTAVMSAWDSFIDKTVHSWLRCNLKASSVTAQLTRLHTGSRETSFLARQVSLSEQARIYTVTPSYTLTWLQYSTTACIFVITACTMYFSYMNLLLLSMDLLLACFHGSPVLLACFCGSAACMFS